MLKLKNILNERYSLKLIIFKKIFFRKIKLIFDLINCHATLKILYICQLVNASYKLHIKILLSMLISMVTIMKSL